ncbi:MAG TPA: PepSY-associated TM helix domain-containing protein [Bryobacteraceae bacterium]|nr:PepSY-associated TM helix domain-containing protein [Bryobacteraceae bacterium]
MLDRPHSLKARHTLFQIHLWCGVILGLYLSIISLTGVILVFEEEIEANHHPTLSRMSRVAEPAADIAIVVQKVQNAFPHNRLLAVLPPVPEQPNYLAFLKTESRSAIVTVDHATGEPLDSAPLSDSFLGKLADFHANLFAGRQGRLVNGIAAVILLLLCATGLAIWWPGRRAWKLGFTVRLGASWKRLNLDLHRVVGITTIAFLLVWGITAIYFVWPKQALALVAHFSSVAAVVPPRVTVSPEVNGQRADLGGMIEQARSDAPGMTVAAVDFPGDAQDPLVIMMGQSGHRNLSNVTRLYFDPFTGRLLATWRYGCNRTAGEWLIWSIRPLHYGFYWGLAGKIVWALFGLSIPVLFATGLLMYWNRTLSKRWRSIRKHAA